MIKDDSRLELPDAPGELADLAVRAWSQPVSIDTYSPKAPHPYPLYLDGRVYQGSSGKVIPLPFFEGIESEKSPQQWQAIHIENAWVRLMILPELGGRIHIGFDKTAGYDFFYRNNVIKPALVGLTGPWISGGVEFNWPQHHRPATYLPVATEIEYEPDGSITVWSSDHDPFERMKGMHGVRLRPDSSLIELRVRLHNRTDLRQTFLWWANVAARVNDDYQSFFPEDVRWVADHAKRAVASFPSPDGLYYGVDYSELAREHGETAGRLDWYRNIPVPTSYMVVQSDQDHFGGYDHGRAAGFVHWADRSIAPGKKQWTWGNSEFGRAWERNLTDGDGPYIELMAGVFTDNQPDFAFLEPGETKTFSQFWYPIREIGPARAAAREVAVNFRIADSRLAVHLGLHASVSLGVTQVDVARASTGHVLAEAEVSLGPGDPVFIELALGEPVAASDVVVSVRHAGRVLIRHAYAAGAGEMPPSAEAPPQPEDVDSVEELYLIGRYLQQYRHPTRRADLYWHEAVRRDPSHVHSRVALAEIAYRSGLFSESIRHLAVALARSARFARTPEDGRAAYLMGLAMERSADPVGAERAFRAASWSSRDADPARYALARLLSRLGRRDEATLVLDELLADSAGFGRAVALRAMLATSRDGAVSRVAAYLATDPLDQWMRWIAGQEMTGDATALLDTAIDCASAGFLADALKLLDLAERADGQRPIGQVRLAPLLAYHRAAILEQDGRAEEARQARRSARAAGPAYAAISRLDDVAVIERARLLEPLDPTAAVILGNWYRHVERFDDAVNAWESATATSDDPEMTALARRNLGVHRYNREHDARSARAEYEAALAAAPSDSRLISEFDQLLQRGESNARRLEFLERHPAAVAERDDLSVEYAHLLLDLDCIDQAEQLLRSRWFQPWEGGEGRVLAVWDQLCLALAQRSLDRGDPTAAIAYLDETLSLPHNLGEARHPLASIAQLELAYGDALEASGDRLAARLHWQAAAASVSDFENMTAAVLSAKSVYSIAALHRLGSTDSADEIEQAMREHVATLETSDPTGPDFFATSLPELLLFVDTPAIARDRAVVELRRHLDLLNELTRPTPSKETAR